MRFPSVRPVRSWLLVLASCYRGPSGLPGYCASGNCTDAAQVQPSCIKDISLGRRHACALVNGGTVWCAGDNDRGQLGTGATGDPNAQFAPVPGITDATQVSSGWAQSCAAHADGTASCWGAN